MKFEQMSEGERRINGIINNYNKGKFTLDNLKDFLDNGLRYIDEHDVENTPAFFIKNLAHLAVAIKRIERAKQETEGIDSE